MKVTTVKATNTKVGPELKDLEDEYLDAVNHEIASRIKWRDEHEKK